jgi:Spy/CpxP family protein refolding chaperone
MARKALIFMITLWLCTASAQAQDASGGDPISGAVIPPDVVMSHQQEIGLSDAQRNAIQTDVQNAQEHFMPDQWKLAAATEKLGALLRASHVDEAKASAQLDRVLDIERRIKHTQIALMIEVKNELTPAQQAIAHGFAAGRH